jgi:hypothetical protein
VKVERSLSESSDALQYAVCGFDPDERLRFGVGAVDVGLDGSTQFVLGAVIAAAQLPLSEPGEPSLDLIDPGRVGGGEVKVESGMSLEPSPDAGSLVRREVVEHDVHGQVGRSFLLDGIQKFHEFDAAVTRTHAANHFAGGHVERGEQIERPMAEVVVGTPLGLPRLERQERLRSLEGLHGRLLVDAEHHRIFGRIQVEADHIANLLD